ncbi:hypothetical protein BDB00DRAFT_928866 [Zychaea mexicana]|uniref:uncharacterized protein n=1 Tax=Zychaea mexicana TaxID=64656 RepID=UPI0022FE5840|nr:uncharacterized protein BDB00DRAFT_928866 [Zychaea mexicana]KAI9493540.1 hypothetical protein BDB00DRAFT_928866 [Zychaea mexicana]
MYDTTVILIDKQLQQQQQPPETSSTSAITRPARNTEQKSHFQLLQKNHRVSPGMRIKVDMWSCTRFRCHVRPTSSGEKTPNPRTVRAVEKFAFAVIDIVRSSSGYDFVVEGTAKQLYLATMAMDALLLDGIESSAHHYVLLRVDGPCFDKRAAQIRGVLGTLAPEKGLSNLEDLHITVARVHAATERKRRRLVNTVEIGFHALTAAMEVDPPPW